jgi:hypothetical protein
VHLLNFVQFEGFPSNFFLTVRQLLHLQYYTSKLIGRSTGSGVGRGRITGGSGELGRRTRGSCNGGGIGRG